MFNSEFNALSVDKISDSCLLPIGNGGPRNSATRYIHTRDNGWSLEVRTTLQSDLSFILRHTGNGCNTILNLIQNAIDFPNIITIIRNERELLNNT